MTREARRGMRTAASSIHIACQVIILWLVIDQGAVLKLSENADHMAAGIKLLQYIGASLAISAIHFSAIKLLTHSHSSYEKR